MIEHLKRLVIGLACLGAFCACVTALALTWELVQLWPIPAGIVSVVLLCWIIGTLART